jgi:type II restriction enzyme
MATIPDYEPRFADAVKLFWLTRESQAEAQRQRGVVDAGTRGAVTGGQHLNSMTQLIHDVFADAGMPVPIASRILPGYYRIAKNWDIVVTHRDVIVAIIELKSQVGSIGKNQNNRLEEMIGQSLDVWRAAREQLLGDIRPWFGYLMLLEDCVESRRVDLGRRRPIKPIDPIFSGTNYLDRYTIAFDRLRREGDMDAVCVFYSNAASATVEYPDPTMTFNAFAAAIHGRVTEVLGMRP